MLFLHLFPEIRTEVYLSIWLIRFKYQGKQLPFAPIAALISRQQRDGNGLRDGFQWWLLPAGNGDFPNTAFIM
jgi:hypothetical protein